jgi:hypothetical protein
MLTLIRRIMHHLSRAVEQMPQARTLALGGIVGPWLWTLIVVLLTVVEYDTLTSFGWTPGRDNGVNYPSSLALGHVGWIQMLNFVVLGLWTVALAVGLSRAIRPGLRARLGPAVLGVAGVGLILTLFPTDHGPPDAPTTWHGVVHTVAFGVALVPLLLAFFLLPTSFRGDQRWRGYQWLCPVIGLLALASLAFGSLLLPESLSQVPFYMTMLVVFVGLTLIGLRLRSVATVA